jgi:hypothetical protein
VLAAAEKEHIGPDEERIGLKLHQSAEDGIDLALGTGLQNFQLCGLRARCFLHPVDDGLGLHIVWVRQQGDAEYFPSGCPRWPPTSSASRWM